MCEMSVSNMKPVVHVSDELYKTKIPGSAKTKNQNKNIHLIIPLLFFLVL